jgi:hypothetical protein
VVYAFLCPSLEEEYGVHVFLWEQPLSGNLHFTCSDRIRVMVVVVMMMMMIMMILSAEEAYSLTLNPNYNDILLLFTYTKSFFLCFVTSHWKGSYAMDPAGLQHENWTEGHRLSPRIIIITIITTI